MLVRAFQSEHYVEFKLIYSYQLNVLDHPADMTFSLTESPWIRAGRQYSVRVSGSLAFETPDTHTGGLGLVDSYRKWYRGSKHDCS